MKSWNELPYSIRKSPRRLYEYIRNNLDSEQEEEPEEEETFTLSFTVTDGTDAIEGASVVIGETTKTTGSAGGCSFTGLEAGTINYSVSKDGYTTVTDSVVLSSDDTVTVTMTADGG